MLSRPRARGPSVLTRWKFCESRRASPRYGQDVDETNVVLEAVPDDAVSFTKGCYVGQEIIARIHWRGHVAKRLAGLAFDGRAEVSRDDKSERRRQGRSAASPPSPSAPHSARTVALGYVKYDYLAPGTEVSVAETAARGTVAAPVRARKLVRGVGGRRVSEELPETTPPSSPRDLDFEQARLAYSII